MFTRRLTLFRILGFSLRVDASWILLALLVTWSLAKGAFPSYFEGYSNQTYWIMGAAGAAGLFVSIILHELAHSVVARRFGIPIEGITLFIFGGVAEMRDQPPNARSEFVMAIAGPIASVAIALVLMAVHLLLASQEALGPLVSVVTYLAYLNLLLALFNLVPAFPLDGGRVLRSILWASTDNIRWATRIASAIGGGFGVALILLGGLTILGGGLVGGLWWIMIGFFLRSASQLSYRQLLMRRVLEGEKVRDFMRDDPVTIPSYVPVRDLIENFIYRYHYKMYPVTEEGRVIGCVSSREAREVPKEEWDRTTVREIMDSACAEHAVRPDDDAMNVLERMHRSGNSRLLVMDGERLLGIITLKDLLKFLSIKLDFEEQ